MASADLRQDLDCSICRSMYTDPVTLSCGHTYCRGCIDRTLDTQKEWSEAYTCPECRKEFRNRPALQRNITLCNIVGKVPSTQPDQEDTGIFCTYCVDSPVPAAKSCLHCEAHLCDKHLRVHSKSTDHVLSAPTTALGNRKCSVHKELFKYYCTEDSTYICVSCKHEGEHQGHQVEVINVEFEKKKKTLRDVMHKLSTKRDETVNRFRSLQDQKSEYEGKAAYVTERVTALFRDIGNQLEDLKKRVLSEISRQEQFISFSVSDLIQQLEIKKDELSGKMRHMEELCNMSDPLAFLQSADLKAFCDTKLLCNMSDPVTVLQEPDTGDTENRMIHGNQSHGAGDLDVGLISGTLHTLSDLIRGIKMGIYVQQPTDIIMDVNTANNNLHLTSDMRMASWSHINKKRKVIPERFQDCPQAISTGSFFLGRHSWEVDVTESESWSVGMCYPSIDRRGRQSVIG
ncbi:E3 ubiquitin-protein ligase TRIM8-like [Pseudophryne corroboree]|uniref:E3 ubiquitin-protein ligase TRIM8-like n=1 Tax=Pseudophryne corroboree TaxID=495146 RepID=UPI003082187E